MPKPRHLDAWGATPTYHGYQGGDLIGLSSTSITWSPWASTRIYFTPVFQSASNHRYHTHDYEKVDPMLGGTPALRTLIDEAHARGIRVVLDGVFNHASRGFFPFHDILENGPTRLISTGSPSRIPASRLRPGQVAQLSSLVGLAGTAQVQYRQPGGSRVPLGNRPEVDRIRNRRLAARCAQRNRRRRLLARVSPPGASCQPRGLHRRRGLDRLRRWLQGDMWDAVMNYQFTRACIAFFIGEDCRRGRPAQDEPLSGRARPTAEAFRRNIERLLGLYHPNVTAVMLNLLGSHDMARFVTLARGDLFGASAGDALPDDLPGAPSIYYGDEIGMTGGHDPANRARSPGIRPDIWDTGCLHEFQRLIALRRQRPSLRRGSFQFLWAAGRRRGVCTQVGRGNDDRRP